MKRIWRFLLFILVILLGIITIKTLQFSSKQLNEPPVTDLVIPKGAVERLSLGIQIPTVSYQNSSEDGPFLALDSLIKSLYPLVDSLLEQKRFDRGTIYTWPGKNAHLDPAMLMAHLDVVPVEAGTESDWTYPPFSGKIADGYIWGRGSLDDKSMAFGILEAVEMMLKDGFQPDRTLIIAFGKDEELGGLEGAKVMAEYLENQGVELAFVLDEGHIIMEEALSFLDPPLAMIGIAEKGYTTLTLTAIVEGGHSSMPPKETAIGLLSKSIHRLEQNPFPAALGGATKKMFEYIGPEANPPYNAIFANLWLTKPLLISTLGAQPTSNAMLRTTTAPTMLRGGVKSNVLPKQASAKINFRILPGETEQSVLEYVRKTIDDDRIIVQIDENTGGGNPSEISSTESFGFGVIQRTIKQTFPNTVVAPALVIAFTDSRHYKNLTPNIYRFMPVQLVKDDLSGIHGINERISINNYENMIRFYHQLVMNGCK